MIVKAIYAYLPFCAHLAGLPNKLPAFYEMNNKILFNLCV